MSIHIYKVFKLEKIANITNFVTKLYLSPPFIGGGLGWGLVLMRLDKFLKVSRLIKRRTVANTVSEMGRVLVNGLPAKPAKQLKVGDIIEIEYSNRIEKVEVLVVPTGNVSVQEASTLYRVIE